MPNFTVDISGCLYGYVVIEAEDEGAARRRVESLHADIGFLGSSAIFSGDVSISAEGVTQIEDEESAEAQSADS